MEMIHMVLLCVVFGTNIVNSLESTIDQTGEPTQRSIQRFYYMGRRREAAGRRNVADGTPLDDELSNQVVGNYIDGQLHSLLLQQSMNKIDTQIGRRKDYRNSYHPKRLVIPNSARVNEAGKFGKYLNQPGRKHMEARPGPQKRFPDVYFVGKLLNSMQKVSKEIPPHYGLIKFHHTASKEKKKEGGEKEEERKHKKFVDNFFK